MQKKMFLLAISILLYLNCSPQEIINRGKVLEGLTMASDILDKKVNYSIYLPPGYTYSDRRYPVVYLLHGYTDDETAWVQFGEVNYAADKAINNGEIPPMIIVMPDAGVTFYINDHENEVRYEDMFFEELIPYIDQTYRTRPKKEFRGVAGLSMGGYGSLVYILRHPDVFAACAALSSAVHTGEELLTMDDGRYRRMYAHLYGERIDKKLGENWEKYSVLSNVENFPGNQYNDIKIYIDCGDDDFLYKGNSNLHVLMKDLGFPHEYRVRDGGHEWEYWRTGITDGLKFIGESFRS